MNHLGEGKSSGWLALPLANGSSLAPKNGSNGNGDDNGRKLRTYYPSRQPIWQYRCLNSASADSQLRGSRGGSGPVARGWPETCRQ